MDILIKNALLLTMNGKGVGAIPDGFIGISGNKITAIGPMSELPVTAAEDQVKVIDARGKVVMPGLIDGHLHAMLTLFRGLAQDMDDWMHYGLAPYLSNLTEAAAISGSALAAVEALKNGTTTLVDFGFPMLSICRVYEEIGLRARVASMITAVPIQMEDLPPGELYPFDETQGELLFYQNLALIEEWHNKAGGRITCMLGPQGPDMVPRELLLRIKQAAEDLGVMIHMHVAQGDRETNQIAKRFNCRSIPYLHQLGLIDQNLLAIHLTEATEEEIAIVAEYGAAMVCCPASIAIIDGIVPPLVSFLAHGGRAALGS
ncbi:MAG: amidohydrolase family protein, partial [Dethiobacteria bacterium]|nr:amidohydrolase family protein [Dethiobacteria bacterium]